MEAQKMSDANRTREQLVDELSKMRGRVAELEAEVEYMAAKAQRQTAQYERHITELAIVNEIGRAIASTTELDTVLEAVHHQINRLFHATNFCVSVYEKKSDEWTNIFLVEDGQVKPSPNVRHEGGAGLVGCMIRNRKSLLFQSGEEIAAFLASPGMKSVGKTALSWLGVPLIVADEVVGAMAVQSYDQEGVYDEQGEALLLTIAAQVAPALSNLRLLEETRQRAEELVVLNELGQALTTRLSVEEVLEDTYRQTSRLLDTTNFYIALYNADEHEVTFPFNISESEKDREITVMSADQGITGHIIRNRQGVLISENVVQRLAEIGIEQVGAPSLSFIGVPLTVGDRVLGVMSVQSFPGSHTVYDEHDFDLLTAIASPVAIALQNAQLYERVQQAYAEVEKQVADRTEELQRETAERERAQAESLRLQQEVIEAQKLALQELSTPIIPMMETPQGGIIVIPLIGSIDNERARDITRALLAGIREHRAKVVLLDVTGVSIVDSGVVNHLNKTIQAARLKGAHTIVTGVSDAVAETIVDLGIGWGVVDTLNNLQTGLLAALNSLGFEVARRRIESGQ
jgi:transcriptional regulator with GAF, ATPase, and Fis domain/anti-anti-sigma regulatory factor